MTKYPISSDTIAVVTGAASGIGRALIEALTERGARTVGMDVDEVGLSRIRTTQSCVVDVSDEAALRSAGKKVQENLGTPDLWFNNAGIAELGRFEEVTPESFDRVLRVNLNGVIYGTRVAMELMSSPERGAIVNTASMSAVLPTPYLSAYSTSKQGVVGFSRSVREELRHRRSALRLVLVFPGFVKTPIMEYRKDFALPSWLEQMVEPPEKTAAEILDGLEKGKLDIVPTKLARILKGFERVFPEWSVRSSRLLVARNWREAIGLDPIRK